MLLFSLCLTPCDLVDCSTLGFPVLHHLPELAQTHVHWVGDAIQPSPPVAPFPPVLSLSQDQGLFQWVDPSYRVAKVLELQHQSLQWIFRIDWFDLLAVQGTHKSLHHNSKAATMNTILQVQNQALVSQQPRGTARTSSVLVFVFGKSLSSLCICNLKLLSLLFPPSGSEPWTCFQHDTVHRSHCLLRKKEAQLLQSLVGLGRAPGPLSPNWLAFV